jgi:aldehyde dehydrogenase (NAD+)
MKTLRVGDPLDKNTDVGAINSKMQLEKIRELVASGAARGRDHASVAACALPEEGLLLPADVLHGGERSRTASRAKRSSGRCSR